MTPSLPFLLLLCRATAAFHLVPRPAAIRTPLAQRRTNVALASSSALSGNESEVVVKASELDDRLGLTPEEKTVVNVHRVCSPSVVYVTSVLGSMTAVARGGSARRGGMGNRRGGTSKDPKSEEENQKQRRQLPRGTSLGSGSGFVVDSDGYIVTNYHVVQRAYEANQAVLRYETFWDGLAKNTTERAKGSIESISGGSEQVFGKIEGLVNKTISAVSGRDFNANEMLPARVFVRFGTNGDGSDSSTSGSSSPSATYHECEIVDVAKELDLAVLKLSEPPSSLRALRYGSSSSLLVGQSLLAIGNPFGLDRTMTSGLVSALGRSVTGVAGNEIKNCIQTDAAINPGNSGGPLLNLDGEVVGVNTMIITTSGSSAGIGFAVPGDDVNEKAVVIVDMDKERRLRSAKRKGRGWMGAEVATGSLETSLRNRLAGNEGGCVGAFIMRIADESPLLKGRDASDGTLDVTTITNCGVTLGDRVVDVGGTSIANGREFALEMKKRVEGERLTLTVENSQGERRVVYVTLGMIPL